MTAFHVGEANNPRRKQKTPLRKGNRVLIGSLTTGDIGQGMGHFASYSQKPEVKLQHYQKQTNKNKNTKKQTNWQLEKYKKAPPYAYHDLIHEVTLGCLQRCTIIDAHTLQGINKGANMRQTSGSILPPSNFTLTFILWEGTCIKTTNYSNPNSRTSRKQNGFLQCATKLNV